MTMGSHAYNNAMLLRTHMLLWELTISNISMCVKMLMDRKAYAMELTLQVPLQEVTCSYILPPNSNAYIP